MKMTFFLSTLLLVQMAMTSDIKPCSSTDKKKTLCRISVNDAKPTQFLIGLLPAKKKAKKFTEAHISGTLHELLSSKIIPVVIGPDNGYYILDGHHTSHGLINAEVPVEKKQLFVKIKKNCSKCSFKRFARYMKRKGNSFLLDIDYEKRTFFELPRSIDQLTDDPYRSLSWLIRKKSCYNKVPVNYLEFIWAKVLKKELAAQGITLEKSKKKKLKKLIPISCDIVKKAEYRKLPGYNPEPSNL